MPLHLQGDNDAMKTGPRVWFGVMLIVVGALILVSKTHMLNIGEILDTYWPLLLVVVGVWMMLQRNRFTVDHRVRAAGIAGTHTVFSDADFLSESTVFGNVYASARSPDFKGGSVSTVFGNCLVDLTAASLSVGEHTLRIDTVFGKAQLLVPATMAMKASADTVLGSVTLNGQKRDGIMPASEWASPGYATASSKLRVDASAVLGEVLITSITR
jgi:predicted membrane protein